MQVEVTKRFSKDVDNLPIQFQADIITIVEKAREIESLKELPNLKKLSGFKNAYRVKIGKHRIGLLTIENDVISFERCLKRDKIYKVFP
jgi:mRNA interferase RelE/StbE